MTDKKYSKVADLISDLVSDPEVAKEVGAAIESRQIIRALLAFRAARGLSQSDVAEKLNCTQSRVSKLESAQDDEVRYGDLRAYGDAVDCDLVSAVMPRDLKPVDKVKCHALTINRHMDDMVALAKTDDAIAEGVARFFMEAFWNLSAMMGRAVSALPRRPDGSPYCEFELRSFEKREDRLEFPAAIYPDKDTITEVETQEDDSQVIL